MIRFKLVCVLLCLVLSELVGSELQEFSHTDGSPAAEFSHHTLVTPRVYHGRHKRHIPTTTRDPGGGHVHDLMIELNDIEGRHWTLNLQLNRDLIPKSYFEKYQLNGEYVVNTPSAQEVDMCHYRGSVQGIADSWAAVSTCQGLSGVIFDGEELHYLEPRNSSTVDHSTPHYLYNHDHLQTNFTCGFPDTPEHLYEHKPHHIHGSQEAHRILRYKRAASEGSEGVIRAPYNSNKMSRYVELVLVVDTREYKELGSLPEVYQHCKKITNIINALYMPLNIFVALVGVVVWTELDDIVLSPNGDTTLANFLHYRRGRLAKEHPNDNAQLLTRMQFDGGVVGKALKGPICTYEFSGGVSVDHSSVVGLVATTVAHEMGHNFGMEHDTSDCSCPSERCIMAPSSNSKHPTHWSSCSLEYLAHAFEHGMDYCLRNKPERLFESPVCGNGFVEPGEQCDCGLPEFCNNPCCNASTCMLFANASCATGECCDLEKCKPRKAGHMCRSADHECDLPEFCTGESEFCKDNVFKMDGEKCDKGKAFCYQGSCRTHSDQCRLLWGPSGASSDSQCYHMNTKGSQHGNCGYYRLNHSFIKCVNENILCGMLHCRHLNERLEYGMESVAILSQTFLNTGGNIIPCRTAIVDLGLNEVDPGLAPDGARCGEGKMCVNQKCLAVDALQKSACPNNCYGRGACNSKGNCHCDVGYAPPYCKDIGYGGSDDSGPASDPLADVSTAKVLIFLFALLFMSVILLLAVFYTRYWRLKKSSPAAASAPAQYVTRCRLWLWLHAPRIGQLCGLKYPTNNLKDQKSAGAPMINAEGTDSVKPAHRPIFISPNDQPRNPILVHPSVKQLQRDSLPEIHKPGGGTVSNTQGPTISNTPKPIFNKPRVVHREQQNLLKSDNDPGEKKKDKKPKFVHRVEEWFSKGAFKEVTRSVDVTSEVDSGHTTEFTMDFKPNKEGGRCVKSFGQASSRLITEVVAVSPVSSPEMHRKIHTPPPQHRSLRLALPSTSSTVSTSAPSTPGSPDTPPISSLSLHGRKPPPLPSLPPGLIKSPVPPRRAYPKKLPASPLTSRRVNAPNKPPPPPPPNKSMKPK